MRFEKYLIERTITFDNALKIFGIEAKEVNDKKALKKKYHDLIIQNHPDKGGDVEIAKDINDAYAVLKNQNTVDDKIASWKERDKEEKKVAEQIRQSLLSNFHPEVFTKYFEQFSGDIKFEYKIDEIRKSWPGFNVEFFSKNKDTVFTLKISADIRDIFKSKGLGSGDKYSYTVYTEAYGFHLNKKQKMSKSDWGFTRDHTFFRKPEQLFPTKKMKDIFSGSTSKRQFKKRDMILFLTKKLNAKVDPKFTTIPLGEDYNLVIYRYVFLKSAAWSVNGIYKKYSRIDHGKTVTFIEEENTAKIFEKIQKEVMKVKGDAKIKKTNQLLQLAYEAYKKSKGIDIYA